MPTGKLHGLVCRMGLSHVNVVFWHVSECIDLHICRVGDQVSDIACRTIGFVLLMYPLYG